jgi:hypothetical protein
MNKRDFTTTILVDKTEQEIFVAINNVQGWWSGEVEGDTDKPGAEFTYHVPGVHFSKQKITEFVPAKKLVWHVIEANLSYLKDKSEWVGMGHYF